LGQPRLGLENGVAPTSQQLGWNWNDLNPDVPENGLELCRRTCWLQDDLFFLCQRYNLEGEYHSKEIIDISKYPEEKQGIYEKTARDFYFKVFDPKDIEDEDDEDGDFDSTDTDISDMDDFDIDSTDVKMLDSTTNFKEDDEEMNRIIAFFAKMPKVTEMVQGMLDMMAALTRILPLVAMRVDDPKLKDALTKTVDMLSTGIKKVLKICAFLGIKVERKQGQAIGHIVKDRFKKERKDFLEYEIDELNKSLDALEKMDDSETEEDENEEKEEEDKKKIPGQIPIVVKKSDLYPQKMPLHPPKEQPIVVVDEHGIPLDKDGKPLPPPKQGPAKVYWNTENGQTLKERKLNK
jgi:hypothetical protein